MNFAKKIAASYKTYIICDDIDCQTPTDTPITFIKISDQECIRTGWTKSNNAIHKVPSAWDKALYYFCIKETAPPYVWFIEEDVFLPRETILNDIDEAYPDADLVAKQNVLEEDDPDFIWWGEGDGLLERPLYRSLVCATRLSRDLLNRIVAFVQKNRRLAFIEILFTTIVAHNNMKLVMPEEMSTIIWRHEWTPDTIDDNHMFHPVKDVRLHDSYRERLVQIAARKN